MKRIYVTLLMTLLMAQYIKAQNIFPSTGSAGIGTATPNASSFLEMISKNKGLLIPRLNKEQRAGITNPTEGLMIFQTNGSAGFYFYDGIAWKQINYTKSSNGWSLTGNSGTNPATNFIGNTDAKSFSFRVNNEKAGVIGADLANTNTGFGYKTIKSSISGTDSYNTAFGVGTLFNNTTGNNNTATGSYALNNNLTANSNTANGSLAMQFNTTSNDNTAAGNSSMLFMGTGTSNTAIGTNGMFSLFSGNSNTAIGTNSLTVIKFHYGNDEINATFQTAAGSSSLAPIDYDMDIYTSGPFNTALGFNAFNVNGHFGGYNTVIGDHTYQDDAYAAYSNSVIIGSYSLLTGSNEVYVGDDINTVNSIGGHVSWSVYTVPAPKSIRENVPGLALIKLLKPVTYNLDYDAFQKLRKTKQDTSFEKNPERFEIKNLTGFIAQEVLVATKKLNYDFSGIDNTASIMRLRYSEFTAPLVKAVQELSTIHDSLIVQNKIIQQKLQEKISEQQAELSALKTILLASINN
ncbi:MAG: hypothetical protein WAU24_13990 [Chitinophagaceae bacterium]